MLSMYVTHSRPARLSPTAALKKQFAHMQTPTSPSWSQDQNPAMDEPLVSEATWLKDRVRRRLPVKLYAFSLAHMRKIAVPPVEIPKTYRSPRTRALLVGGHQVPFTKAMWTKAKRRMMRRQLDRIHEDVAYD